MPESTLIVFNIQKFCLHDGPGIRTAVFVSGCPLRCGWCSNPESQRMGYVHDGEGIQSARRMTVSEIMAEVRKDAPFYQTSGGGLTVTGGEVLMQMDGVLALLSSAKDDCFHTCAETSCYGSARDFGRLIERLDMVLPDLKHHDPKRHRLGTGTELEPILGNLKALARSGVPHRLRIPVIPGYNDALSDAARFAALIGELGISSVELLPFHQFGERKYELLGLDYAYRHTEPIRPERLAAYTETLRAVGLDVEVGG